jgi:hypothetical protein
MKPIYVKCALKGSVEVEEGCALCPFYQGMDRERTDPELVERIDKMTSKVKKIVKEVMDTERQMIEN